MQFRPAPLPLAGGGRSAQRPSWSDRGCPLDTAGDRCLWHAGGTRPVSTMWLAPVGEGSPLAGRVRLTAGDDGLVGKPRSGAAATGRPDHGQSSRLLSCPREAHATTTPGSDNRSAGETSPPGARLPSAVQQALMTSLALRTKTRHINTCNLLSYHCVYVLSIR
jgi:hypothetical protein